jgi:putative lipoprotein
MKKCLLTLLLIGILVSACSAKDSSESLLGAWKLVSYGAAGSPTPVVADAEAGLTFNEDGTVTGNSGCNGFGGDYTVEGDQVTFGQVASTLMACDDARMAQEDAVHKVLTETATYQIAGDTLTITNNDMVLILKR